MTLHQLKIFEAVAEQLNITAAARKVRISQPSITKQLRLLEREWGLKLYVKDGRGIRLTEAGRLFRVAAKPIVDQTEELKRHSRSESRRQEAKISPWAALPARQPPFSLPR